MKLIKNNKQMGGLQAFILGVGSATIVLAVILIVLTELEETSKTVGGTLKDTTTASNATNSVITKLATIPTWIGIIIVVAMAFIVLGYFYLKSR